MRFSCNNSVIYFCCRFRVFLIFPSVTHLKSIDVLDENVFMIKVKIIPDGQEQWRRNSKTDDAHTQYSCILFKQLLDNELRKT